MTRHTWITPDDHKIDTWICSRCGCRRHRTPGYACGFTFRYSERSDFDVLGMPPGFARWTGERPDCPARPARLT